ncbi:hypothetical protein [Salinibacter altiplanensis]|uniref:hypothetical protein n=1 Tax=Salinibacter altiplanensis TaxID=1803181 RepID=UPI001F27C0BF|nr:hypothetical protein [Salinibacter altiplanensis]
MARSASEGASTSLPIPSSPRARVGAGSFDTRRLSVTANSGLLGDRYVVNARFSRVSSDGYRRNAWTTFTRFFGGLARYGDRSTLKVQAFGGLQKDGLAFSGIPKSANDDVEARRQTPSAVSDDRERFHPPQIHLTHEWRVSPTWMLNQTAFWIKGDGHFDYGAPYRSAAFLRLPDDVASGGERLTDADPRRCSGGGRDPSTLAVPERKDHHVGLCFASVSSGRPIGHSGRSAAYRTSVSLLR